MTVDFDISPADTSNPTGPQRFKHGFFGGPATGVVLHGHLLGTAVVNFMLRVNSLHKQFTMSLDHTLDPSDLDNIRSNSNDVHRVGTDLIRRDF